MAKDVIETNRTQPRRPGVSYFPDGTSTMDARLVDQTGVGPSLLMSIPVPADSTLTVLLQVDGHRDSNGDGGGYVRAATFKRIASGNVVQVGATTSIATHEDDAAWDVAFTVSLGNVLVSVVGVAAQPIQWSGRAYLLPAI